MRFRPRADYKSMVERALAATPPRYLAGLSQVLLRDTASLTAKERKQRGRSGAPLEDSKGLYVRGRGRRAARIELFVDNIESEWPRWMLFVPGLREVIVSEVLFHELGHHIHLAIQPTRENPERVAELWSAKLTRQTFFEEHPRLALVRSLAGGAIRLWRRLARQAVRSVRS